MYFKTLWLFEVRILRTSIWCNVYLFVETPFVPGKQKIVSMLSFFIPFYVFVKILIVCKMAFFNYVITDIFRVMKYLRECTEAFCTKYGSLWSRVFSYVQLPFTQQYQSVPFSTWIKFSAPPFNFHFCPVKKRVNGISLLGVFHM